MTIFTKMVERADGWTDWIQPRADSYKLMCCDCGLVHELQFGTVYVARSTSPVRAEDQLPTKHYLTIFRARRLDRSTANSRRRKGRKIVVVK